MKEIQVERKFDADNVKVYLLSDWHHGVDACDLDFIERYIKNIKEDENALVICAGDLINNTFKHTHASFDEYLTPEQQIYGKFASKDCDVLGNNFNRGDLIFKGVKQLLDPISDKIIAMIPGNHEQRTRKHASQNPTYFMSESLGVPDTYVADYSVLVTLKLGRFAYDIYVHHGFGGGRTKGAKINNVDKLRNVMPLADVIVTGHHHTSISTLFCSKFKATSNVGKSNRIRNHVGYLVVNGGCMEWDETYAEEKGYDPAVISQTVLILANGKNGKSNRYVTPYEVYKPGYYDSDVLSSWERVLKSIR